MAVPAVALGALMIYLAAGASLPAKIVVRWSFDGEPSTTVPVLAAAALIVVPWTIVWIPTLLLDEAP